MCPPTIDKTRLGERLSDGSAHEMDHALWSRRQFMKGIGMLAAGASLSLAGTPVQAFYASDLLSKIARLGTNRILVIVQLNGGNDGLNTVVPITNDVYYGARPGISISPGTTLPLSTDFGFHPSLAAVHPMYANGDMAIVQGVGYPSPNLSHFLSTDVWKTGRPVDEIDNTGWAGRHLDLSHPDFSESPPDAPLAVQIGSGTPFLFQGPSSNMGMALASVSLFEQIAESGKLYKETDLPDSNLGDEIGFLRSVTNDSYRYAGSIQTAAALGENDVEYPGSNSLASKLAIVAQLIKGQLGSSIYHVNLTGFDTHANQLTRHNTLMRNIAEAIKAFQDDLGATGMEQEVLVMTFSEFGRRVTQNGSEGTDHGTAAPMLLFGTGVAGGLYGAHPSLTDLDGASNMKHTTDFRSVYASVLTDWFGLTAADVNEVLGGEFPSIEFITDPTGTRSESSTQPQSLELAQNYPNPFNPSTRISFSLDNPGQVELSVFDLTGRLVTRMIDSVLPSGKHEILFEAGSLPSGQYVYRLKFDGRSVSKKMTLLR